MGLIERLTSRRTYLDANIFIYALEGFPQFETQLRNLFNEIDSGRIQAFTSELTLSELLVKPFSDNHEGRITAYQEMLDSSPGLTLIPVSRQVLVDAARLRATFGMKTPDAIHAAAALSCQCAVFLTNDKRLALPSELELVPLDEGP